MGLGRQKAAWSLAALALAFVQPAEASTAVCRQLQAELTDLSPGNAAPDDLWRLDEAIDRQVRQLMIADEQWQLSDCTSAALADPRSACFSIADRMDAMEANLVELERERDRMIGREPDQDARERLLAVMEEMGCELGATEAAQGEPEAPADMPEGTAALPGPGGSIVTLPDASAPDAAPSPSIARPEPAEAPASKPAAEASLPTPPPTRAEPAPAREMTAEDRKVRVVGPRFLPDREEAIDLRAPGRKPDR